MNVFSKRSDIENENDCNTSASKVPSLNAKRLCYFNDRWKDNWIREVNNPSRAYCTICRKEFGIGHGGEGDMQTVSHKSRMRQVSAGNQSKVFSYPKKTLMFSQK